MGEHRDGGYFSRYRTIIYAVIRAISMLPQGFRLTLFERCRRIRGKKGIALRFMLLKTLARSCGESVTIYTDVHLLNPQNLSIGSNVSINPMSYIECGRYSGPNTGVFIGNNVSVAHHCTLMPGNHAFNDLTKPIRQQGVTPGFVRIQDNVWLGAKVTLLSNITVASGCVIGAGAVITREPLINWCSSAVS